MDGTSPRLYQMDIYHGIDKARFDATAIAIGVFDGVHLGHQAVLSSAARMAHQTGLKAIALTFDINPAVLIAPERAPLSICTVDQRAGLIDRFGGGIDATVVVHFDHAFAALSPDDFVRNILKERLGATHVFVGTDFRYGHKRAGDAALLASEGAQFGFTADVVQPVVVDGERVSSTRIRSLIQAGDVDAARRLLGHPFSMAGTVVTGKKLGREIGFPTANLAPIDARQLFPADGVYAAYATLADGRRYRSAVSVGTNPTTARDGERKAEAYIMDGFDEDIYDQELVLSFDRLLRGQVEFKGLDPLIAQIKADVDEIDRMLAKD